MKKKCYIFTVLVFSGLFLNAQEKIWDYPLKPGMEEWATLKTYKQKIDTCQIPLNVLNTSDTKDLVTICLNYPMFNDYIVYTNERRGILVMINRFNGLKELTQREDKIAELVHAYSDFPILTQLSKDPASKEYHLPYKLPFLELILCDTQFLNSMNSNELETLRTVALNKYKSKLQNQSVYSLSNIKKTMFLIASVMNRQNSSVLSSEQQEMLKIFIKNYDHCSNSLLTEISKIISL
ncbi:MAG: hypothetical protein LBV41_13520 [Cytophagaceae bacterium]|jgi:carbonic anhydrase|nr:hypothetical protein [Cytophagaceae bacterium]